MQHGVWTPSPPPTQTSFRPLQRGGSPRGSHGRGKGRARSARPLTRRRLYAALGRRLRSKTPRGPPRSGGARALRQRRPSQPPNRHLNSWQRPSRRARGGVVVTERGHLRLAARGGTFGDSFSHDYSDEAAAPSHRKVFAGCKRSASPSSRAGTPTFPRAKGLAGAERPRSLPSNVGN